MPVDPKRVQAVFLAAADQASPADRAALLARECGDDAELRQRVEALLQAHDQPQSFLNVPAADFDLTSPIGTAAIGTQIGPYKLLQQIGEGGFGIVFMAEQTEPVRRRVALKVIKPGMDTRQVIARFEAERQALAVMDHPNIAKVLDAGTVGEGVRDQGSGVRGAETSNLTPDSRLLTPGPGRPYFVMELVRGVPITQYCDENSLSIRERLELFASVCQAIQHAHTKGIIHRDIKPTNVLVTRQDGQPVVKVIDFGIAKALGQQLTDKTLFTEFAQMIGTPLYMSPEQAELSSNDIDTRSDIYSLGVLLYELLTGSTPVSKEQLKQAAFDEIRRIIREDEPEKPSTRLSSADTLPSIAANRNMEPARLGRTVRGELDWIVMKALEKDRARRYETANGFAADLQRYLSDEAVLACPPSAWYRLRKFSRRNKGGLAVAALVLFFLVLLGSGIGWAVRDRAAQQAGFERERLAQQAEAEHAKADRQQRLTTHVEQILNDVDRLEGEQKWPEALIAARRAEAAVAANAADAATAQRVRKRLRDLEFIDQLEQIRMQRATIVEQGRFDNAEAVRAYPRAFRDYGVDVEKLAVETSVGQLRANPALAISLAGALDDWVDALRAVSQVDAVGWKRLVAVARGIDPEPLRDRLRATLGLPASETQDDLRRLAESIDVRAHRPATLLILASTLREAKHSDSALRLLRSAQYVYPGDYWLNLELGKALFYQQDREGAIRFFTAAISIHPSSASVHHNLGSTFLRAGRKEEAIAAYQEAIRLQPDRYQTQINLGCTLIELGRKDEGFVCLNKAIDLKPDNAGAWNTRATNHLDVGQFDRAVADYSEAIRLNPRSGYAMAAFRRRAQAYERLKEWDKAIADYKTLLDWSPDLVEINANLAWLLAACPDPKFRNPPRAVELAKRGVELGKRAVEKDPNSAFEWYLLGCACYRAGDWQGSLEAQRRSIELDNQPKGGDSRQWFYLAMAQWRLGEKGKAREWYDKAVTWMDKHKLEEATRESRDLRAEAEELMGVAGVVESAPPPLLKE